MLGTGVHEIRIWQKGTQPLEAYIRENDVGLIISLGAGQDSVMVNDREWNRFQNSAAAGGFTRVSVPNHEAVGVYVRSDLLPKRRASLGSPYPMAGCAPPLRVRCGANSAGG